MAITKRQIELEVRANNLSNKPMDEVIRNINELSEALEVQAKLAEQGQGSVADLSETYEKLTKAGNALVSQSGVVEQMGLLANAVEKARDRVSATTKTLDDYKVSISGIAKLTGEQSAQLSRLEKAAKTAGTTLERQTQKFTKASDNAERIGVGMDNLADANDRVAVSSKRLSSIQKKVTDNFKDYSKNIAEAADAAARLKAQEDIDLKITDARKIAEYTQMFDQLAEKQAEVAKTQAEIARSTAKVNEEYARLEAAENAANEKRRSAESDLISKRTKSDAALLEKIREADYARMFDELAESQAKAAAQADHNTKETDELERELATLGTTIAKASKEQLEFAKASAKAAKEANAASVASKGFLGNMNQLQKSLIGGERTSLGFFQRMRGELLSLIAVYVGFQGAVDGAKGALQAFRNEQATQVKLLVATNNDTKAAADEYAYLRGQAERLGIAFQDIAAGYASFRIAAKDANVSVQDTRFIFESISEAGVKLNLSRDNIQGIQKALEQMVSKGVASTEELGQQLGDRLPGVMQVAAKQMGFVGEDGVARFRKALENGTVDSVRAAAALARGLNDQFANIDMSKSLVATEGRFQTALEDWKRAIAESGLVDAYTELLKKITEVMKSAEGKELAAAIGKTFGAIANAIGYLIDNLDMVKLVFQELVLLFAITTSVRLGAWFFSVVGAIKALATMIGIGLIPALSAVSLLLGALMLIPIGIWAYGEFETFRKTVDAVSLALQGMWEIIKLAFKSYKNWILTFADGVTYIFRHVMAAMLSSAAKVAKYLGNDGLAGTLDEVAAKLRRGFSEKTFVEQLAIDALVAERNIKSLGKEYQAAMKTKVKHAKPEQGEIISPITGLPMGARKTKETGSVGTGLLGIKDKDSGKAEADKYASTLESLTNRVAAITAQSQKKEKENLSEHLAGITKQYEGLFKDIGKLNAKDAAVLRGNLQDAVDSLSRQVTADYWQKQLDGLNSIKAKYAEMDVQLGKNGGDAGRAKIAEGIAAQFAAIRAEIEALDLEKLGGVQHKMELLSKLKANEEQTTDRALNKDLYREAEAAAAKAEGAIAARDQAIQVLQSSKERGLITEAQMYQAIADKVLETQPIIEAATLEAIKLLEALRGAEGVDTAALDAYILKLKDGQTSYRDIRTEIYSVADANKDLANIGGGVMDSFAKNIAEVGMGFTSWSDGIKSIGMDFAKMAADYLRKLAMMIIQQQILNALTGGGDGGGLGGGIAGVVGGLLNHTGGVVGSTGARRNVSASWFANAPRYHTGGIAGLAPNEYPSILKKNEEVLTENDPRNILNGGMAQGGQAAPAAQDVKVINMIDSGSFVSEGMSTPQGVKAVLNMMQANRTQFKSILG